MKNYVIGMNLTNCLTSDLNPIKKCLPENCYEKYFGKRNFFNKIKKLCEIVPDCGEKRHLIYDSTNNQCVDFDEILTDDDLSKIKSGEFDTNLQPPEIIDQNVSFKNLCVALLRLIGMAGGLHIFEYSADRK